MTSLYVPGASIYYETMGYGPLLLCISGADGSCDGWRDFAERLKETFQVVMWDRRGFSRSTTTNDTPFEQRLQTDADDAARLISHLSPNAPAFVIGNSSGAIVSLKLLVTHPEVVKELYCYEPPLASILPDFDELWGRQKSIFATYQRWGSVLALARFSIFTKSTPTQIYKVVVPRVNLSSERIANTRYWFEQEFLNYPKADFDVERDFGPFKDKLILVNGKETNRAAYQWRANAVIEQKLGLKLEIFPGEHLGHLTDSEEFAEKLLSVYRARR